jgi:catechol 2,3-dioxygenase-like lactoylglutathione lyase family enzyme
MDAAEFEAIFQHIKAAGIPYSGTPWDEGSMQGAGMTHGARGLGKAVYFRDPSGHLLEIKTYYSDATTEARVLMLHNRHT